MDSTHLAAEAPLMQETWAGMLWCAIYLLIPILAKWLASLSAVALPLLH